MQIFYLKAEEKVELENACVKLSDVADILCEDDAAQKKAEDLAVYCFSGENRAVIDVLRLIGILQEEFPGSRVVSLGAGDVLVERRMGKPHPIWEKIKIILIALLSFFGAAFTIMAFHNDISIEDIFSKVYRLVTGMESDGLTVLEVSYSIGLSAGIILFFNHIGTRRITKDPTPIEVQMRQYESDVVTALVENANREQSHAGEESGKGTQERPHARVENTDSCRETGEKETHAGSGEKRESANAGSGEKRESANAGSATNRKSVNAGSATNRKSVNAESAGGEEKEHDAGSGGRS